MTDLLEDLQQEISRRETEGEPAGFWKNHSLVQTPFKILSFRGSSDALVLLYLYERAGAKSFRSDEVELIELVEREETIAQRTGLSLWAVSKSVKSLETAGCIRVERRHNPVTGEKSVSIYILLHSQTAKPLHSAPGLYGVCQRNFEKQYVTMPSETRENIIKFPPAARQVYLTALALGSSKTSTKFACSKETWLSESLLGRKPAPRKLG